MKVLNVIWVSSLGGQIGIVTVRNEMNKVKTFVRQVAGNDEEKDIQTIIDYGGKLTDVDINTLAKNHSLK